MTALFTAWCLAVVAAPAVERVYDVVGRVHVPRHGEIVTTLRARVLSLDEGLVQLSFDQGGKQRSRELGTSEPLDLHRHPFFFRRARAGQITRVLHHVDEPVRTPPSRTLSLACFSLSLSVTGTLSLSLSLTGTVSLSLSVIPSCLVGSQAAAAPCAKVAHSTRPPLVPARRPRLSAQRRLLPHAIRLSSETSLSR
jgi:hypothetical protein